METVLARGVRVNCLLHGHGPKNVLLMHGTPSNPFVYDHFLAAAPEDQYRIVVVDWFGDSGRPWGGYNVSGFADQARDIMDTLEMPRATVGGHSLGGVVAQMFALRYGSILDKLILIGTGANAKGHGRLGLMIDGLRERGRERATLEKLMRGSYGTPPPEQVFRRYVDYARKTPVEAFVSGLSSILDYDFAPLLEYIDVPTLIVHGRQDTGRIPSHGEALRDGIPNSRLAMLDCGHYVMEELPEEFDRVVLEFLAE